MVRGHWKKEIWASFSWSYMYWYNTKAHTIKPTTNASCIKNQVYILHQNWPIKQLKHQFKVFFSLCVMSNQVSVVLEHVPSMWCEMIRGRELWHESAIRIHQGTQSKWTKKKNPVVFQKHFTVTEWFVSIKYNMLAQTPSSSLEISGGPVLTRKVAIQTWIYTRTRKLAKNAFVLNQFSRWTLDQDLNFG